LALEAPAGYVRFVARHLDPLRAEVTAAVHDEQVADRLYPEVLTDVARRWGWLELRRTVLGQSSAADGYLRRSLARRTQRFLAERNLQSPAGNSAEWYAGPQGPERRAVAILEAGPAGASGAERAVEVWQPRVRTAVWSSQALRQADYLRPATRVEVGPVAEAAIAWWHGYEARRRRTVYLSLGVLLLLIAILLRLESGEDAADSLRLPSSWPAGLSLWAAVVISRSLFLRMSRVRRASLRPHRTAPR
jgi:hypothetical protein